MPIELNKKQEGSGLFDFLQMVFYRLIALYLLIFAIQYWIRIVGLMEGPQARFDTMAEHWQIAAVTLSVIMPVAALGLWGRFPWGPLVWMLVIATELTMYIGFPELFGVKNGAVIFHLICLGLYMLFLVSEVILAKKE